MIKTSGVRVLASAELLGTTTAGAVMGIYDREYYRGETRGSGWLSGASPACKTIILINVVVFFLQQVLDRDFVNEYLAASSQGIFRQGRVWQLLTATFLHDSVFHILWNML